MKRQALYLENPFFTIKYLQNLFVNDGKPDLSNDNIIRFWICKSTFKNIVTFTFDSLKIEIDSNKLL